jgi:HSP20 family protein
MAKLPTVRSDGGRLARIDDFFKWDPFAEIANVRRTMNSLLDSALSPSSGISAGWMSPAIDLYEKDGKYVVEAAIPGLKKDDINIEISDNRLTLTAKQQEEREEKNERYHYREVRRGGFARSIMFPQDINADQVDAEYKDGILRVSVPMEKPVEAKKVAIKG